MKDSLDPGDYIMHLGAVHGMNEPFVVLDGQIGFPEVEDVTQKIHGFLRVIHWYLSVILSLSTEDRNMGFRESDLLQESV